MADPRDSSSSQDPDDPDDSEEGGFRSPYRAWKGTTYGIPFGSPGNLLRREPERRQPRWMPILVASVIGVICCLGLVLLLI